MMIFFMSSTHRANSKLHAPCKLIFSEEFHAPCKLFSVIIIRKAPPTVQALLRIHFRLLSIDGRNHRCSELKNQARRCTLGTYNFEPHLAYRTPVIQQRLPPLLLLLGSSVRHVSRNHRHPKAFGKRVTTSRMNQSTCHLRMVTCTEVQGTTVGPTQSGSYYVKGRPL